MEGDENFRVDWTTPLSQARDVEFARLLIDSDLRLICYFWVYRKSEEPYFVSFTWEQWDQYKCTDLLKLTGCEYNLREPQTYLSRYSCTVAKSLWVKYVQQESTWPQELSHYVLFSVTTSVEILSSESPTITKLTQEAAEELVLRSQTKIKSTVIEL